MLLASLYIHYPYIQISCLGNYCFVHLSWQSVICVFGIIKKTNEVLVISGNGEGKSRNTDFALSPSDNVLLKKKEHVGCKVGCEVHWMWSSIMRFSWFVLKFCSILRVKWKPASFSVLFLPSSLPPHCSQSPPITPRYACRFVWSGVALGEWTTILPRASHEVFSVYERKVLHHEWLWYSAPVLTCTAVRLCKKPGSLSDVSHTSQLCGRRLVCCCDLLAKSWQAPRLTCSNPMRHFRDSLSTANIFNCINWANVWFPHLCQSIFLKFTFRATQHCHLV